MIQIYTDIDIRFIFIYICHVIVDFKLLFR